MNLFCRNLQFIFRPSFWALRFKFCPEWDKELNELLDNNRFEHIPWDYTPVTGVYKIGDCHIWVESYPYAFARKTNFFKKGIKRTYIGAHRPSRLTMLRVKKRIDSDLQNLFAYQSK